MGEGKLFSAPSEPHFYNFFSPSQFLAYFNLIRRKLAININNMQAVLSESQDFLHEKYMQI